MRIWKKPISVEELTAIHKDTAAAHLGIEFLEVGDDFIRAPRAGGHAHPAALRPAARRGIGRAGGDAGVLRRAYSCAEGARAVGLDINANHLRGATAGWVTGVTRPVHIGRTTQVWQIDLSNDAGELTCVSRITMAVLQPK